MNIVDQVGWEYFSTRFNGCVFIGPSAAPHYIEGVNNSRSRLVQCKEVESYKSARNVTLPYDFFESFKFLAVPEVGWRAAEGGRLLVRLERNNTSYTRGITLKNLTRDYAMHTEYMFNMGKLSRRDVELPAYTATLVTKPEHMSMRDGLEAMNKGEIMAFTNSAHIAVVPESNTTYNILCGSSHVANVSPEGEVTLMAGCEDFELETLQ